MLAEDGRSRRDPEAQRRRGRRRPSRGDREGVQIDALPEWLARPLTKAEVGRVETLLMLFLRANRFRLRHIGQVFRCHRSTVERRLEDLDRNVGRLDPALPDEGRLIELLALLGRSQLIAAESVGLFEDDDEADGGDE